jgi:hypothetical protein
MELYAGAFFGVSRERDEQDLPLLWREYKSITGFIAPGNNASALYFVTLPTGQAKSAMLTSLSLVEA